METVWKQWVSRQYWRKQRSNSGWCEQTLILSLLYVFFPWGIDYTVHDDDLPRQWTSLYKKIVGRTRRKTSCFLKQALQLLLAEEAYRLDNIAKPQRFWYLICVYKSLYQINPISSKSFHLACYFWRTFFSSVRKWTKPHVLVPFKKALLDKKLWRLDCRPKWVFLFDNFKVVMGGYFWYLAQHDWQPTFQWEALSLLSGLGMVAELDVSGVGRERLTVALLSCSAAA